MNTTIRSLLSASVTFVLTALTAVSAYSYGVAATITLAGVTAIVVLALIEIMLLDYAPTPRVRRGLPAGAADKEARGPRAVIIAFPQAVDGRRAA